MRAAPHRTHLLFLAMSHESISSVIGKGAANNIQHARRELNTVATSSESHPEMNESSIRMVPAGAVALFAANFCFLTPHSNCFDAENCRDARVLLTVSAAHDAER